MGKGLATKKKDRLKKILEKALVAEPLKKAVIFLRLPLPYDISTIVHNMVTVTTFQIPQPHWQNPFVFGFESQELPVKLLFHIQR